MLVNGIALGFPGTNLSLTLYYLKRPVKLSFYLQRREKTSKMNTSSVPRKIKERLNNDDDNGNENVARLSSNMLIS